MLRGFLTSSMSVRVGSRRIRKIKPGTSPRRRWDFTGMRRHVITQPMISCTGQRLQRRTPHEFGWNTSEVWDVILTTASSARALLLTSSTQPPPPPLPSFHDFLSGCRECGAPAFAADAPPARTVPSRGHGERKARFFLQQVAVRCRASAGHLQGCERLWRDILVACVCVCVARAGFVVESCERLLGYRAEGCAGTNGRAPNCVDVALCLASCVRSLM